MIKWTKPYGRSGSLVSSCGRYEIYRVDPEDKDPRCYGAKRPHYNLNVDGEGTDSHERLWAVKQIAEQYDSEKDGVR